MKHEEEENKLETKKDIEIDVVGNLEILKIKKLLFSSLLIHLAGLDFDYESDKIPIHQTRHNMKHVM